MMEYNHHEHHGLFSIPSLESTSPLTFQRSTKRATVSKLGEILEPPRSRILAGKKTGPGCSSCPQPPSSKILLETRNHRRLLTTGINPRFFPSSI